MNNSVSVREIPDVKRKILPLESTRGLAALVVCFVHFASSSPLSQNRLVTHGDLMVDFFFVLSGFVIAMNYVGRITTTKDLVSFQKKRFWRLYPLHLFTLAAFVGIEILKLVAQTKLGMNAGGEAFQANNGLAFFHNFFMTHAIFLKTVSFNYPSWSISTEFYTYLIFGIVMLLGRTPARLVMSAALMVLGFGVLFMFDPQYDVFQLRMFRCFYAFFLGVLLYYIYERWRFVVPDIAAAISLVLSVAAICYLGKTDFHILVPVFFAFTVLGLAYIHPAGWLSRVLSIKPLVYLGTISYSIYLMHASVWWFFKHALRFVADVESQTDPVSGQVSLVMSPVFATAMSLLGLCIILGVSHFSYTLIEDRFRKGIRKA